MGTWFVFFLNRKGRWSTVSYFHEHELNLEKYGKLVTSTSTTKSPSLRPSPPTINKVHHSRKKWCFTLEPSNARPGYPPLPPRAKPFRACHRMALRNPLPRAATVATSSSVGPSGDERRLHVVKETQTEFFCGFGGEVRQLSWCLMVFTLVKYHVYLML